MASGPATAGNLLIAVASNRAGQTYSDPSGWNRIHDGTSASIATAWWWKVSDGTESSIAVTQSGSGNWTCTIAEYDDAIADSPFDVAAENEANIASVVASQSTGTTGTTSAANSIAIALFTGRSGTAMDADRAYTNSFAEDVFYGPVTNRPGHILASKVLSATGTVECTFSNSEGTQSYGSIAVFKLAGGGGPTFQPAWALGSNRIIMPGGVL